MNECSQYAGGGSRSSADQEHGPGGIDKGYFAHQKYGYDEDLDDNGTADCSDPDVSQPTGTGGFCLAPTAAPTPPRTIGRR